MKGSVRIQMLFHMSDSRGSLDFSIKAGPWGPGRGYCTALWQSPLPLPPLLKIPLPYSNQGTDYVHQNITPQQGFLKLPTALSRSCMHFRCGRAMADNIAYAKCRKSLLI